MDLRDTPQYLRRVPARGSDPELTVIQQIAQKKRIQEARDNNTIFDARVQVPDPIYDDISNFNPKAINPLLGRDALDFYGLTINLQKMDKVKALENELVRDYHMRTQKALKQKENAEEEYALMLKHFTELKNLSETRLNKILELKEELDKLQGKYERDMAA